MKDNQQRYSYLIQSLWVVFWFAVPNLLVDYLRYDEREGIGVKELVLGQMEIPVWLSMVVSIGYSISYLVTIVLFLQWFYRAYENLRRLNLEVKYEPGWTVGGWFIPIVNLVLPAMVMTNLFKVGAEKLRRHGVDEIYQPAAWHIQVWWMLWVLSMLEGVLEFKHGLEQEPGNILPGGELLPVIGDMLMLPLALAAIRLVTEYGEAEKLLDRIDKGMDISMARGL